MTSSTLTIVEPDADSNHDEKKHKRKFQILVAIIAVLVMLAIIFISLYATAKCSDDDSSSANKNSVKNPTVATTTIKTTGGRQHFTQTTESSNFTDGGMETTLSMETTTDDGSKATKEPTTDHKTTTSMDMMTTVDGGKDTKKPTTDSITTKIMNMTTVDDGKDTKKPTTDYKTTTSMDMTTTAVDDGTECKTQKCLATAKRMMDDMDMTADPCVDFSQYACGNFYKTAVIPDDRMFTGSFAQAQDRNLKLFTELLTGPMKTNSSFEAKMRSLYNACMDEDAIEKHGLKDYTDELREDWPTLNPAWNKTSFHLQSVVNKYLKMFTPVLFTLRKKVDNAKEERVWKLEIADPNLLLDKTTLIGDKNSTKIMALETYYKEFSMALGANETGADADAKEFVEMIRGLAQMLLDPADTRNIHMLNNPTTLGDMDAKYTYLNWTEAIQSMFDINTKKIEPSQKINIENTKYIEKLGDFLNKTAARVIQNMFGFIEARERVSDTTKQMRQIELNFKKASLGVKKEKPRREQCGIVVDATYNYGMAKLISNKRFSKDAKTFMDGMIDNLKQSYKKGFESVDWMEDDTKRDAINKLEEMDIKVGTPDEHFNDTDLDNMYKDYKVGGNFSTVYLQNKHEGMKEEWNELGQEVKKWKWTLSLTWVDAAYVQDLNEIGFPLGILQPPFFDQDSPGYLNYGAIGMIIGHEIGHLFDAAGRNYDARGRVKNWWTSEDHAQYNGKTQCYVDQYSRFNVTIGNSTYKSNGELTKTENVPDSVGLIHAYQAYKTYQQMDGANNLTLPNLHLNNDQLFFLSFGHVWCRKIQPQLQKAILSYDTHSVPRIRINGALQNHPGFTKAYSCKIGDDMNPKDKCTLW